jgi:hypothetical protein
VGLGVVRPVVVVVVVVVVVLLCCGLHVLFQ